MELLRVKENPILAPTDNWWEEYLVFNPGATIFEEKILLLYRAQGRDRISRFGLAVSNDGVVFERFSKPILDADPTEPFERLGIEDPRITKIDDVYYITYTAASVYPIEEIKEGKYAPSLSSKVPWRVRASLLTTKDFRDFQRRGVVIPDLDTKDLGLFPEKINGKYFLFHRIYPDMYLTASTNIQRFEKGQIFARPRPGMWDSERIGLGAPPIKTEKGWLIFYHGVDDKKVYRLGLMLADLADPFKILYRSTEPILEPTQGYEKVGYVKNVVFTCGVVEKDDKYLVYYGAADQSICLATANKDKLISELP